MAKMELYSLTEVSHLVSCLPADQLKFKAYKVQHL